MAAKQLGIIILAAGRGTRMRSDRAKVLHTIAGKPFVVSVVETAAALVPTRLAVVVGHEAAEVERVCAAHLARQPIAGGTTSYPRQIEQRGTGDAVRAAEAVFAGFDGDVLILYGDVPGLKAATLGALVEQHRASGATLSLLTSEAEDPTGYGRIVRGPNGRLRGIVEERDLEPADRAIREINPGIYCARAGFLWRALARLRADNVQREYYLTDIVAMAVEAGEVVETRSVPDAGEVAGINSREDMAVLEQRARRDLVERWMRAGVTFRDPATAYLEEDVTIGSDTEIGPNVQLLGRTAVGRSCVIDGTAVLRDASLGDGVHLRLGVVMTECEVGPGAIVGPFAHIRPGSVLAAGVHIGNFVETKKAKIGRGTKANHLTYLGDCEIGAGTNIGAGTITCNYDGFAKHRTVIGDRVQIGSDTQLVAPVTVGDDAYVGAGTTVTVDVPAGGHLVVSRVPQRTIAGWVARKRAGVVNEPAPSAVTPAPRKTVRAKKRTPKRKVVAARGAARAQGGRRGKR
ncbi:MAG: bifunctional UDP-N-acetylglucosamine diphosphorylase/glucosamine-1-phosphate N-acetyltransferase GlmU [Deltaproteobacteria bacterium]|nr:bifunctional UDP-N-acetylglucosamine diphosphorylase/glucosamine-1-phosphate N-acetyltransferase GlmU [Deltaproteobacteria bacterium]